MTELLERLRRAVDDIEQLEFVCALVGGFAVGLRVRPRMTKDIDLAVAISDDSEAESLVRGLHDLGYQVVQLLEQRDVERLSMVRVRLPNSSSATPEVDILFASCGIEREIVEEAEMVDCVGLGPVRVARIGHLIAMKVLSVCSSREQDKADLRALIQSASTTELERAQAAACLIEERGFQRDKDLRGELKRFIAEAH